MTGDDLQAGPDGEEKFTTWGGRRCHRSPGTDQVWQETPTEHTQSQEESQECRWQCQGLRGGEDARSVPPGGER